MPSSTHDGAKTQLPIVKIWFRALPCVARDRTIMDDPAVSELDLERLFAEHAQPLYGFLPIGWETRRSPRISSGDTFERVVKSHARYNARKGSEKHVDLHDRAELPARPRAPLAGRGTRARARQLA